MAGKRRKCTIGLCSCVMLWAGEDLTVIKMGGPGKVVEGDGMFLIGKRKCGVGRYRICFLSFGETQHIGLSAIFVWIFDFRQSVLESLL